MSESEHDVTDILLPPARVAVFSADAETLKSGEVIQADWRFARVEMKIREGDVEAAIEAYKREASPDLMIIQTENIDEAFTDRLGALSEYCNEGTSAVIVGPVNDVNLYRRLIDMGVSDYLVRPVETEILAEVIARALVEKLGVSSSRLIAFIGAKGGVGTTAIAQACAWGVSDILKQKTVLIDAAGGWSTLGVGMGFDPATTLAAASRAVDTGDEASLNRMFHTSSDRLSVLAGGGDPMLNSALVPDKFEALVDKLMVRAPVVLVDLSGAEPSLKRTILSRAHKIVLVTTPMLGALRLARSLMKDIGDIRGGDADDVSLLVNMAGLSKNHEIPAGDIETALECKPVATISFMPSLFMGHESEARKILTDKDGAELLRSVLLPVLKKTVGGAGEEKEDKKDDKSGLLGGFLTKLTSK